MYYKGKRDINIEVINIHRIYTRRWSIIYIAIRRDFVIDRISSEKGKLFLKTMDKMYINVFSIKKNKLIIKENKFNNKLYKLNFIS